MTEKQLMQLSRGKYIEESRDIAIIRLNERKFHEGEPVVISYYKTPNTVDSSIGTLLAIGLKEGIGKDCYRFISMGDSIPVDLVTDTLPDVSALTHGETVVYHNLTEKLWYFISIDEENHRKIEVIEGGPFIFFEVKSGYRWFYSGQTCKREDDYFSALETADLLNEFVNTKIYVGVSSKNGQVFRVNEVKDVILDITAFDKDNNDVAEKCKFFIDGEEIFLREDRTYILENQSKDSVIVVEAKYDLGNGVWMSFTGDLEIKFGYDFYYGAVEDDWSMTKQSITKLSSSLSYKKDFLWDDIKIEQKKTVLAYPKRYGYFYHIFDVHGIDYIHSYQAYDPDIQINGTDYVVYILKDPITISDLRQVFTFNKVDSLTLDEDTLEDIAAAWRIRNSAGGLVRIDGDGKIPEELYNLNANAMFSRIVAIVEEYPDSGLTVGDLYYNSIEKTFFTAVTENSGVISIPKTDSIYNYDGELYKWSGTELRLLNSIGARLIVNNSIEDEFYK